MFDSSRNEVGICFGTEGVEWSVIFMCLEQDLVEFLLPWLGHGHLLAHAAAVTAGMQLASLHFLLKDHRSGICLVCRSRACRRTENRIDNTL